MQIEDRAVHLVTPYERNPRHNADAVAGVADSILEFGFRQPLVVDAEGVIVIGHTRYRAALELGLETVPVHVATELSAEQVQALRIADNATGDVATWDEDLLPLELADLQAGGVDLGVLGLDDDLMSRMLDTPDEADDGEELTGKAPEDDRYKEQFGVIVICTGEEHQQSVYEELTAAGKECRVVTT